MAKKYDWRRDDPDRHREARRYDKPGPSRRYLLHVLKDMGVPAGFDTLARALRLKGKAERQALGARLGAMVRDGQIILNRRDEYCLLERIPVVSGSVVAHKDGFGFVVRDDGEEPDIYLAPRQMRSVVHGDRVAVRIKGTDRRGRPDGSLVEVIERKTPEIVGRYVVERGVGFVVPDNPRITHNVMVARGKAARAKNGQIVMVRITEWPTEHSPPVGEISEVMGDEAAPGMETDIALRAHGLPHRWSKAVREETGRFGRTVPTKAKKDREDLRGLPLVTIDGADARDFDDAVYAEPAGKGWRLIVAIADVAHYVRPGTALDGEAVERGTSVYFPNRVVPMLPEELSNGLCSLNPKVDRLCMVCEMRVSPAGKVTRSRFYEGVMKSAARLTYGEVAAMLYDGDSTLRRRHKALLPALTHLDQLYRAFAKARRGRGAIDFDMPEVRFSFDERGRVSGVTRYERNDAHKIIEECMIAANVQAARFLRRHRMPTLYRCHGEPDESRVDDLRLFLGGLGLSLPGKGKLEPKHYRAVLAQVAGRPDAGLIEMVLLRSMQQAEYAPKNIGHFGLALPQYAHFTSPIRRYPDLLVHRGIRHVLRGGKASAFRYSHGDMGGLGMRCSAAERRADEATREALDWLKCEFMQDKIGEEFDGIVIGVTDFGLFVQLDDIQVEGLVHVTSLGSDYFRHDRAHHRLVGERSGEVYRLTDPLRVRVVRASLEDRKIDFELVDDERRSSDDGSRGSRRRRSSGRRRRR